MVCCCSQWYWLQVTAVDCNLYSSYSAICHKCHRKNNPLTSPPALPVTSWTFLTGTSREETAHSDRGKALNHKLASVNEMSIFGLSIFYWHLESGHCHSHLLLLGSSHQICYKSFITLTETSRQHWNTLNWRPHSQLWSCRISELIKILFVFRSKSQHQNCLHCWIIFSLGRSF